jgi:hypothetical protein
MSRHEKTQNGSGKRREELLQVRVAGTEKEAFEQAADLSGLALSAWVRERLRSIAARELQAASRPIAFLDPAKE